MCVLMRLRRIRCYLGEESGGCGSAGFYGDFEDFRMTAQTAGRLTVSRVCRVT